MSNNHLTDTQFKELSLPQPLLNALTSHKFTHCTPIQAQSLPIALKNQDVIGQAQTGTGKTIAFLVAAFARLYNTDQEIIRLEQELKNSSETPSATSNEGVESTNSEESLVATDSQDETPSENTAEVTTNETSAIDSLSAQLAELKKRKNSKNPRALIIAPTRELALQIYEDAELLNTELNYKIGLAYGGNNYKAQQEVMEKGVDIVIGTPGRIIDFNKQKLVRFDDIEVLVMDEADRMFDLGFLKDIRFMLRRLPDATKRLNMLFSATVSYDVEELAYEHMNQPTNVAVESVNITATRIEEKLFFPASDEKLPLLKHLIDSSDMQRAIVFINTKHVGERVAKTLIAMDYSAGIISGDVAQNKREKLLDDFRGGKIKILVATDVAARGIHIDDVDFVINYDLPNHVEDYVHRIGRTARAGASGHAISFACETYSFILPDIEEYIEHKIPVESIDSEAIANIEIPKVKVDRFERNTNDKRPSRHQDKNKNTKPSGSRSNNAQNKSSQSSDQPNATPRHLQETEMVVTPAGNADSNRENRIFSKHGYEIPAFG